MGRIKKFGTRKFMGNQYTRKKAAGVSESPSAMEFYAEVATSSKDESPSESVLREETVPEVKTTLSSQSTPTPTCSKRKALLDEILEAKRKEHEKDMEIKAKDVRIRDLKIRILEQKLEYWIKRNNEF